MEMVERFLFSLQGKRVVINLEDGLWWKEAKDGNFSVKSFYSALEGSSTVLFLKNIIWSPGVPTKVSFFAWEATWGKALTMDQLKKRGWSLPNRCYLCCAVEESIDHLLIHCTKARILWAMKEILLGWHGLFVGKNRVKVWKAAPLCLFWTVWKKRNKVVFENEDLSIQRMKYFFVCNLWSWSKCCMVEGPNSSINFFEWLGYGWGRVSFLYPYSFCFWPIGACCILPVCFGLAVGPPVFY